MRRRREDFWVASKCFLSFLFLPVTLTHWTGSSEHIRGHLSVTYVCRSPLSFKNKSSSSQKFIINKKRYSSVFPRPLDIKRWVDESVQCFRCVDEGAADGWMNEWMESMTVYCTNSKYKYVRLECGKYDTGEESLLCDRCVTNRWGATLWTQVHRRVGWTECCWM